MTRARDVHPLCHMWPQSVATWRTFSPEEQERIRRVARNKRKAWRQKQRGRK